METPICDFVRRYAESGPLRLHMPGHKGAPFLGPEPLDITEIPGADVLYDSAGVIRRSEENAAWLFGSARTLYSAEGSSLCIRAMLYLALVHAKAGGRKPRIAAGRNAHRVFLSAAALLGLDVAWLYPEPGEGIVSCTIHADALEELFRSAKEKPTAVYITSPDYLGQCADLAALAEICHRYGALLLVDNAHGAYLRFLPRSAHPMDLGADLCCDSAHKTLNVLTGGAYLHLSPACPATLAAAAELAMTLFASTSPSYLILQSLDSANRFLAEGYAPRLAQTAARLAALRDTLRADGWETAGTEPLKLTLCPKSRGYTGRELAALLRDKNIFCEFFDPDYIVFMVSPETPPAAYDALLAALRAMASRPRISARPPILDRPEQVLTPRQALLAPFETVEAARSAGRVLAGSSVSCPPAVPIVVCGERINESALRCFSYYGVSACQVVKEPFEC